MVTIEECYDHEYNYVGERTRDLVADRTTKDFALLGIGTFARQILYDGIGPEEGKSGIFGTYDNPFWQGAVGHPPANSALQFFYIRRMTLRSATRRYL